MRRAKIARPMVMGLVEETGRMVAEVEARLPTEGCAEADDVLVILPGAPITARGSTHLPKLHRVGEVR